MKLRPIYQITRHPIGSIQEVWTISWPLILGLICNGMMVLVDRLMLGHYSLDAMNASSTAGAAAFSFFILPMVVAGISEVFVGRYHGLGKNHMMGESVWQMVWFSILIAPLFLLSGIVAAPFLFNNMPRLDYALSYFYILINFGSIFCINQALMGFFIGQGKVHIITLTVAFANIVNIVLDYALIFGTPITPSLGVQGAAIATIISQFALFGTLFFVFINKKNRTEMGTAAWKLRPPLFIKALRVGVPASFAHLSEYVCFFVFLRIMSTLGHYYLTIAVLLNSVYMILYFIIEGISKGVTAVSSNLIGASKHRFAKKNLLAGFKLHAFFVALVTIILSIGSTRIFSAFIGPEDQALLLDPFFLKQLKIAALYMCLGYLFDGMIWILVGLLTAAGDTRFIMVVGTFAPWLMLVAPMYFIVNYVQIPVSQVWLIIAGYCFVALIIYWIRYKSDAWKKEHAAEDPSIPIQEN